MSKLTNILLASLLLVSTVGITVDKHYCNGHFIGTWFYVQEDACEMDMPMDADSCHDDVTFYSVENEFQFVSTTTSPELQLLAYVTFPIELQQKVIEEQFTSSIYWQSDLPPPTIPKIYIKVQSFLI